MKFHQLPNGARFEYQGKVYVKTSPVVATAEEGGGQRLIPRSAVLKPVSDSSAKPPASATLGLDPDVVMAALAQFHDTCARILEEVCPADRRDAVGAALDDAARSLVEALSENREGPGYWRR